MIGEGFFCGETLALLKRLIKLIDKSKVTVLEHPPYYKRSSKQIDFILKHCQAKPTFQIDLDMHHDHSAIQYNRTMNRGYLLRRLIVLEPIPMLE